MHLKWKKVLCKMRCRLLRIVVPDKDQPHGLGWLSNYNLSICKNLNKLSVMKKMPLLFAISGFLASLCGQVHAIKVLVRCFYFPIIETKI